MKNIVHVRKDICLACGRFGGVWRTLDRNSMVLKCRACWKKGIPVHTIMDEGAPLLSRDQIEALDRVIVANPEFFLDSSETARYSGWVVDATGKTAEEVLLEIRERVADLPDGRNILLVGADDTMLREISVGMLSETRPPSAEIDEAKATSPQQRSGKTLGRGGLSFLAMAALALSNDPLQSLRRTGGR